MRNTRVSQALILMSFKQALLHRFPEPSVRLFTLLSVFAALVVMTLAMLDGSAHDSIVRHVPADTYSKK
jgi:membrane-anchored protein YejM (alkaline phosphatase superfamily)